MLYPFSGKTYPKIKVLAVVFRLNWDTLWGKNNRSGKGSWILHSLRPKRPMCIANWFFGNYSGKSLPWNVDSCGRKEGSESCSVMPNSLGPHGLYSPWNSPGQNIGVGSLSLLQGIFPTQGSNPGFPHCRQTFYQLSQKRSPNSCEACPQNYQNVNG